jgi:hypothetical protein
MPVIGVFHEMREGPTQQQQVVSVKQKRPNTVQPLGEICDPAKSEGLPTLPQ